MTAPVRKRFDAAREATAAALTETGLGWSVEQIARAPKRIARTALPWIADWPHDSRAPLRSDGEHFARAVMAAEAVRAAAVWQYGEVPDAYEPTVREYRATAALLSLPSVTTVAKAWGSWRTLSGVLSGRRSGWEQWKRLGDALAVGAGEMTEPESVAAFLSHLDGHSGDPMESAAYERWAESAKGGKGLPAPPRTLTQVLDHYRISWDEILAVHGITTDTYRRTLGELDRPLFDAGESIALFVASDPYSYSHPSYNRWAAEHNADRMNAETVHGSAERITNLSPGTWRETLAAAGAPPLNKLGRPDGHLIRDGALSPRDAPRNRRARSPQARHQAAGDIRAAGQAPTSTDLFQEDGQVVPLVPRLYAYEALSISNNASRDGSIEDRTGLQAALLVGTRRYFAAADLEDVSRGLPAPSHRRLGEINEYVLTRHDVEVVLKVSASTIKQGIWEKRWHLIPPPLPPLRGQRMGGAPRLWFRADVAEWLIENAEKMDPDGAGARRLGTYRRVPTAVQRAREAEEKRDPDIAITPVSQDNDAKANTPGEARSAGVDVAISQAPGQSKSGESCDQAESGPPPTSRRLAEKALGRAIPEAPDTPGT